MSLLPRPTHLPSNAQLTALLDGVDELLLLVDARQRLSFCNRLAQRLLGCEPGQPLALALGRLDSASQAAVQAAVAAGRADAPLALRMADGQALALTPARVPGSGWSLRGPAPDAALAQPPLAAGATSELIRLLWDSPQPLLVQDADFVVVAANRACCEVLDRRPEQLLGQDLASGLTADEQAELGRARERWRAALADGRQAERPADLRLPGGPGGARWLRYAPRWVSADDGAPLLLALLQDVTAEHQARHQAEHSGHELDGWFDLSPIGMLVYDARGLVLRSNAAFEALVGRSPVRLRDLPADVRQLLAWEGAAPHADLQRDAPPLEVHASVALPDGRRQHLRARLRAFASAQGDLRVMAVVEDRSLEDEHDLAQRWLLTRVEPGELAGGRPTLSVVTLDVTEQEAAHRRSEQLLRELTTILEGTSTGLAYLRGEQLVRCNQRFEAMLGLAPTVARSATLAELLADQPAALARMRRALAEPGRHEIELQRRGPDGAPQWYILTATVAAATPGVAAEGVLVLSDVSGLKAQQAALETLARERELMFSLSDVGLAYLRGGRIKRGNEALAQLTGYAAEELPGLHLSALFVDEDAYNTLWLQQQAALQQSGHWRGERRLRRRDGRAVWVQVSKRLVDERDLQAGLICSYEDVDERHRAREAVQLQAERTRAILDSVLVGIVTVGDGGIEWMNRSARRMFGGELADFVGQPIAVVATADADHPLRATHYLRALGDGQAETFECRLRGRDGREFWVVGNAVVTGRGMPAGGGPGTGSQITFALLDIERRRQAEVSIAQAQASLQRIIDTAPMAIALFDAPSGRLLRLNHMAASFLGRPTAALLGRPPEDWFAPDEAAMLRADLADARARPEGLRRECQRPGPALPDAVAPAAPGSPSAEPLPTRVWDMRIVALDDTGEAQLLLVASDVTEQRQVEQARFDAAVSQREMLVKEVHHRIKNNLQGVAGLLQQTAVRRPEVAGLINEAVGQVQAIAQVHGLQVGVSGPLRIKPLIEAITASVQRTFGRAVAVQASGTPPHRFALPEAESIPIALTINELLTNAIKHGAPGAIRCALQCDEARLTISVFNPGQLPAGFTLAQVPPGVSGLGLVRALLPRRSATLTLLQAGSEVEARIVLVSPGITLLEPL